jgi:hypothetical protein
MITPDDAARVSPHSQWTWPLDLASGGIGQDLASTWPGLGQRVDLGSGAVAGQEARLLPSALVTSEVSRACSQMAAACSPRA